MQDRSINFSATCFVATMLGILGCLLIAADYLVDHHSHYGLLAMPLIGASMVLRIKVYFVKMGEQLEDYELGRGAESVRRARDLRSMR